MFISLLRNIFNIFIRHISSEYSQTEIDDAVKAQKNKCRMKE